MSQIIKLITKNMFKLDVKLLWYHMSHVIAAVMIELPPFNVYNFDT